jgi:DNA-binding MarR family transcriptional regulator
MPDSNPLATLNPSIVGQAEKAHTAILWRVLAGTCLDEQQWITVQLAAASGDTPSRRELVERVASAAKYDPNAVETAIAALTGAGLISELPGDRLSVTGEGRELVKSLRAKVGDQVGRAYGSVPAEDLAIAARVLTTITTILSEDLASA